MESCSPTSPTSLKQKSDGPKKTLRGKKVPRLVTKPAPILPESSIRSRRRLEAVASSEFRKEIIEQFEFYGKRKTFNSIVTELFGGQLMDESKPIHGILKTPTSERKRSKSLGSRRRVSIELSKNQYYMIPCNSVGDIQETSEGKEDG